MLEYYVLWGVVALLLGYFVISLCLVTKKPNSSVRFTWPLSLGVIGLSSLAYMHLGDSKGLKDSLGLAEIDKTVVMLHQQQNLNKEQVTTTLAALEKRLPPTEQTLAKLAGMYESLGLFEKAQNVYQQVSLVNPNQPYYAVQGLYCQVMQEEGKISVSVHSALEQLNDKHPAEKGILNLLALHAFQNEQFENALAYWQQLLQYAKNVSQSEQQTIQEAIRNVKSRLGLASVSKAIQVTVNLKAEFVEQLKPDDVLYVFAKQVNGPPMPVAVVKQTASNFPKQIQLSDENSMLPQLKLSDISKVKIGARISKSGQAIPTKGDWEGETQALDLDEVTAVEVTINEIYHGPQQS